MFRNPMADRSRLLLRIAFAAIVVVSGLSLLFTSGKGVEANLLALLGNAAGPGLQEAASAMATSAKFLVKADSPEVARARLESLGVDLPPAGSRLRLLDVLEPYACCFLSPSARRQLERRDFAAVRDAAAARLFSPVPPVLSPRKDPFLLFTDCVLESSAPRGEWIPVDVDMTPDMTRAALAAVKGADDVRCAGAPFHTALATESSRREINALSLVSLACVVLFGRLLTGSFRFLPVLLAALAAAFCTSAAALFACFAKPHAIALVFGTTLIGMSVDYVYHALTARRSIARPLTVSFLSTAACFLPLLFSDVEVLNQIAVFTIAGLAAVYLGVMAFGRRPEGVPCEDAGGRAPGGCTPRGARLRMAAAMALVATPVLCTLFFGTPGFSGLSGLHRLDPYLAEGERIALEASGGEGLVPPAKEQLRNFRLVKMLYAAEGENYCGITGLPRSALELPDEAPVFAPRERLEESLAEWQREAANLLYVSMLVLFAAFLAVFGKDGPDFILSVAVSYAVVLSILICMGESCNFFARICFFVFMGLGFDYSVFRRHMLRTAGGDPKDRTGKAVFFSFLTSFVGFGLLAFTDFAVTRLMGIVLAAGLAASYLAAKLCCGISRPLSGRGEGAAASVWHEQREQCASLFWAKFMWYSYAWFGKNFQKLIFVVGMPVIYIFSLQGRIALKKFYSVLSGYEGKETKATVPRLFMHILGFAWGLMDKTDACTLRKNPPHMSVRNDDGWRRFRDGINAGRGAFVLCSHVGTVGVLPSLPDALVRNGEGCMRVPKVNAFQQMGHDAVFMKVFMEHFDGSRLQLHAVEDIGVETAVAMKDAIGRGELVIMAGDRVSAGSKSTLRHRFLGRDCVWPKGVYRFARLMDSPVFAVTCVRTGWNRYEVRFAALERDERAMLDGFVSFLEKETLEHPGQWYQFYDFFGSSGG